MGKTTLADIADRQAIGFYRAYVRADQAVRDAMSAQAMVHLRAAIEAESVQDALKTIPLEVGGLELFWAFPSLLGAALEAGATFEQGELDTTGVRKGLIVKYSPDQPRVPAGSPEGGEWTGEGGASGNAIGSFEDQAFASGRITRESGLLVLPDGRKIELAGELGSTSAGPFGALSASEIAGSTFTHTHPNGSVLSWMDMHQAARFGLGEVRSVGILEDGTRIISSAKLTSGRWPDMHDVTEKLDKPWAKADRAANRLHRTMVRESTGDFGKAQANWLSARANLFHGVYRSIFAEHFPNVQYTGQTIRPESVQKAAKPAKFSASNAGVQDWIREYSGWLIRDWGDTTQQALGELLARTFGQPGMPPSRVAKLIYESGIGLNARQAQAVANLEARLRQDGKLSEKQIKSRVGRYAAKSARYRAQMIARTEAARATAAGQEQLWLQGIESGRLPANVQREWSALNEPTTCEVCHDLDGQRAGINQFFTTTDGQYSYYAPPDPHVQCRCILKLVSAPAPMKTKLPSRQEWVRTWAPTYTQKPTGRPGSWVRTRSIVVTRKPIAGVAPKGTEWRVVPKKG